MNTKLFILAFGFAPLFNFIEKYIWDDWTFLIFMVFLVGVDTATGMLYAWKQHEISSKKMKGLLTKVFAYGATLITVHIMSSFTVKNQPNTMIADILPYLDSLMYSFLVFREVLSINENLGKLGYPMLPKFILKRLADFDENGLAKPNVQGETVKPIEPTITPNTPITPITPIEPINTLPK